MVLKPCQPPPPLKPGDLLRAIAPSGCLRELAAFDAGVEIWRSQGYQVEISPGFDSRWGYLAGTDSDRRQQLIHAWQDPQCRGILCARGGYGSTRLLENFQFIPPATHQNSKWLIGFSDITALLWHLVQSGISGVHAPLLTTIAQEPAWSQERLFNWVAGNPLAPLQGQGWGGGSATGILLPANLTVATCLIGTPGQLNLEGTILALEDVSEAPYRIDRMLTQWRCSGAFQGLRGIALGRFSSCEAPSGLSSFTVEEVLRDRLGDLGIPIVSHLPFGHEGENAALPVGISVQLDGTTGILTFI